MGEGRGRLSSLVVAIDGTAGSGKSSTSRAVADRLGLRYLDTGAMYRAVTVRMLREGVDVDDPDAVADRAASVDVRVTTDPADPRVFLNGDDVSVEVRSDLVTAAVSAVSAVPAVRELLRRRQRDLIGAGGIVIEGRDIGTVVAPDAGLKIYLTADAEIRARRRAAEMATGQNREVGAVEAALIRRDVHDSTRPTAPLSAASDSVPVDTTYATLDEVVDEIVGLALDRVGVGADG